MRNRYVSFSVGSGRCCIPVDQVVQIVRPENILEVPKAPAYVDGAINVRGDVIPVVNLRARLGIRQEARVERAAATANADRKSAARARIVVTRIGNRSCGLAVDEVSEIVDIDDEGIQNGASEALGRHPELLRGVFHRDSTLFFVLDLPRVVGAG
ncbi:MAG TPA: chemotaxis protein CheW, partial [Spirochaetia bacterium]|nr:chemotaxis protein CheW [Spirochaetia bacterium]